MSRQRLCRIDEIPEDCGLRVCPAGSEPIAVFRCEGEVYVVQDTCPHAGASLAEGWVESHRVACPAHNAEFCLRTGAVLSFPANEPIKTFTAQIVDGEVFAELTVEADEAQDARSDVSA